MSRWLSSSSPAGGSSNCPGALQLCSAFASCKHLGRGLRRTCRAGRRRSRAGKDRDYGCKHATTRHMASDAMLWGAVHILRCNEPTEALKQEDTASRSRGGRHRWRWGIRPQLAPALTSSTSRSALLLDSTVSTCRSESNLGLLNRASTRLISSSKCSQSTAAPPSPPSPPEADLRYCSRTGGPEPAPPGGWAAAMLKRTASLHAAGKRTAMSKIAARAARMGSGGWRRWLFGQARAGPASRATVIGDAAGPPLHFTVRRSHVRTLCSLVVHSSAKSSGQRLTAHGGLFDFSRQWKRRA